MSKSLANERKAVDLPYRVNQPLVVLDYFFKL
jgi:hypothetical protein